ncbi:hypothetical protein Tco_1056883, partial [Tanacetum coccineum]
RLISTHELYKFSDGTLILVRDKLKDMANNLELGYSSVMPRRRWSNLDKKRYHIMVKDIDHQLLERRLLGSLENFVGGREYEEDLRLLQRTIKITTLAEHIIVAGAENCPPMLEKSMYNSLASRIRLFIKGKKNRRMTLDSIDNGLLVYLTVKENGQTRPKKYSELTEVQW